MKLESLLLSPSGSQPRETVSLRHAEERMAARLVKRLDLTPPIDVEALCSSFADLSFKEFPIEIDGLCLDLKVSGKRPKIWVSKTIAPVRRRFTLAHEIGHIIIPWHTGTIVDDIEIARTGERSKYREMEAEANRFAAELLMPSVWTTGLSERSDHAAALMHSVREIAQVSFPAAFLKAAKFGRPGFVGAEVRDGIVVRSLRTPETKSRPIELYTSIHDVKMPASYDSQIVHGNDSQYHWWKIRESLDDPGHDLPSWRLILDEILIEIPAEFRPRIRSSVNAIVGAAIGMEPKGGDVTRTYKRGMEATQNRENQSTFVNHVLSHPKFKDYVLARSRDRANQQ